MQFLYCADSLLDNQKYDSARTLLSQVKSEQLTDKERAFFILLNTQSQYVCDVAIKDTAILDYVINYYQHHRDNEKLARAYHYKSTFLYDLNYAQKAIYYCTLAENIIKGSNLSLLNSR